VIGAAWSEAELNAVRGQSTAFFRERLTSCHARRSLPLMNTATEPTTPINAAALAGFIDFAREDLSDFEQALTFARSSGDAEDIRDAHLEVIAAEERLARYIKRMAKP
jgi:hypothetical protein